METLSCGQQDKGLRATTSGKYNHEKSNGLFGAIFMCNKETMRDCLFYEVFGLPFSRRSVVEQVVPGMVLFLFEYEERQLHGIFEASSFGGIDIEPEAFKTSGSFPCQVRCKILKQCAPLYEFEFKKAIKDNYFSESKFKFNLTKKQVFNLIDLFLERIEGPEVISFHCTHEQSECFPGAIHSLHPEFKQVPHDRINRIMRNSFSFKGRARCKDILTNSKFELTSGHGIESTLLHTNQNKNDGLNQQDITDTKSASLLPGQPQLIGSMNISAIDRGILLGQCDLNYRSGHYALYPCYDRDAYTPERMTIPEINLPMETSKITDLHPHYASSLVSIPCKSWTPHCESRYVLGCMNQGECSGATHLRTIIGPSDASVHIEGCEQSSSSARTASDENFRGSSSHKLLSAFTSPKRSYRDSMQEKASVWSRISGYKGPRKSCNFKKESSLILADQRKVKLVDDKNTDETSEVDAVIEDPYIDIGSSNLNCTIERNLFNFTRKKTLVSPCNQEDGPGKNQVKKRRKLIRPDFAVSTESSNQSEQNPDAIGKTSSGKQIAAENNISHDQLEFKMCVKRCHFNFDLNQPSMEVNMEDMDAVEINFFEEVSTKDSSCQLNPWNVEAGSTEMKRLPSHMTGMHIESSAMSAEDSVPNEHHFNVEKEHPHAIEMDLNTELSLTVLGFGKEEVKSISGEVLGFSEQYDISQKYLHATASKDIFREKGESASDCPLLIFSNNEVSPVKQEGLINSEWLSFRLNEEQSHVADISSDVRHGESTSSECICLTIETPSVGQAKTAEELPLCSQEFPMGEYQSAANFNECITSEGDNLGGEQVSLGDSAWLNILHSGVSLEEEVKGTAGELSYPTVSSQTDLPEEEH